MKLFKHFIPMLVIIMLVALLMGTGMDEYLSFESLVEHHQLLSEQVAAHALLASLVYLLVYIVAVALSLPASMVMTLTGGFLFGAVWGAMMAVTGATIGATLLFLVAKTSLGDFLLAKAGNSVKKLQKGFEEDVWSYMFVLRIVPIFPFFLVNLAPAFLGVPLRVYVVATFIGIIPGAFVYALAGSGLSHIFEQGKSFSPVSIFTPEMMFAFAGLGLLALLPVIYKRLVQRKGARGRS